MQVRTLPAARRVVVVWDDSCSFCAGWVRWFRRLDWFSALDLRPLSGPMPEGVTRQAATEAMQAVLPNGAVRSGYEAVVAIARLLPLTMPVAPLLALLRRPGDRFYRAIALQRTCSTGVTQETTGLTRGVWLLIGIQVAIPAALLLLRALTGEVLWYGWGWQMFS